MTDSERRPAEAPTRRARWAAAVSRHLAAALASIAVAAALVLFVIQLRRVAESDEKVLPWAAPLASAIAAAGEWISRLATRGTWVSVVVLAAIAVFTVATIRRRRGSSGRRDMAAPLFFVFAALSVVLLASAHVFAAALATLATGVAAAVLGTDAERPRGAHRRGLLLVPLALGFLLRFAGLAERPPGYAEHAAVHHAELSVPLYEALGGLLHADRTSLARIWDPVVTDQHGPNSLVAAVGFAVFGVNLTASRLTSAVLGTLTILLAYGVGTRVAGPRAGLTFAFLLAVVPWHISISRYEDTEHVLSPLQALATLYFLFGVLRQGRWRDFLGLGGTLGLCWYVYSPNQTLPLIVAACGLAALKGEKSALRGKAGRALLAAACFVAVSYPTVADFIHRGRALPVRSAYQDNADAKFLSPTRLAGMTRRELVQLFVRAEDPWFFKPGGGLSLVASVLVIPGLAWCAVRLGRKRDPDVAVLFLVGLPAAFLPAILAPDESFRRLILFALLALLLSSVLLKRALAGLPSGVGARRLTAAGLSLLAVVGAATSAHAYFDLTHVYETESHRYHQEMTRFVRAQLGTRYVTIVAAHDWDVDDHNRYLAVAAYRALSELSRRGVDRSAVFTVVKAPDLARILAAPPTIDGRGILVAESFLANAPFEGVDVSALVARDLPGARASVFRASDGTALFTWWEFETTPRASDPPSPSVRRLPSPPRTVADG